jgi:hypothetical protein
MNFIINFQQMFQVFPIALIALLLYLAWLAGSISRNYRYVARRLKFDADDKADGATNSVWTLADKSLPGRIFSMVIYGAIVLVVLYV